MHEIEYLRSQVGRELGHLREVRAALSARLATARSADEIDAPSLAAAEYLLYALQRVEERDRLHCARLRAQVDEVAEATPRERALTRAALEQLERLVRDLHDARQRYAAAFRARRGGQLDAAGWLDACRAFDAWYDTALAEPRHSVSEWLERYYTLADWRRTSLVDAEAVLEERRLHAAALAALEAA